jgi:hypothetical protein
MKSRRRSIASRDQHASAFSAALSRLCDSVGAEGAALVDAEGETVDYAGAMRPFDIKVAAAECVVLLALLRSSQIPTWPDTQTIVVRAQKRSFFVQTLADGYSVVLQLPPGAFDVSHRGIGEAIRDLCAEAGLDPPGPRPGEKEQWCRIQVRCADGDPRSPRAVWLDGSWTPLEVLGRWTAGLGRREVGYRARLSSGAEVTLVRERLGRWYSDSPISR